MVWFLAMTAVARAECGDPAALIDTLERAAVEGRFDAAEAASEALVAALGCGELADPALVARMWLAEAVILSARNETEAADNALAAAARVSPTTWNEIYGPTFQQRWDAASRRPSSAPGQLRLGPLPEGTIGAIDGIPRDFPVGLAAGLHLLQVGTDVDHIVDAKVFDLPSGLDLVLEPKLPVAAPSPVVAAPVPVARTVAPRTRRIVAALVVGGAGALAYGATFGTSAAYSPESPSENGLRTLNNGLVVGSAGLGLTSAVLLVRGIATPGQ